MSYTEENWQEFAKGLGLELDRAGLHGAYLYEDDTGYDFSYRSCIFISNKLRAAIDKAIKEARKDEREKAAKVVSDKSFYARSVPYPKDIQEMMLKQTKLAQNEPIECLGWNDQSPSGSEARQAMTIKSAARITLSVSSGDRSKIEAWLKRWLAKIPAALNPVTTEITAVGDKFRSLASHDIPLGEHIIVGMRLDGWAGEREGGEDNKKCEECGQ